MAPAAPIAVLDIDGVLADVGHRLHFISGKPRHWSAFFAAAGSDSLLPEGLLIAQELSRDHEIRYLTGRPRRLHEVTVSWLEGHGLPGGHVNMRPNRDFRPARIFKREVLRKWRDAGDHIGVVVDDDPQVIASLDEAGFPTFTATWADRSAPGDASPRRADGAHPSDGQQTLWTIQEQEGRT